MMEAARTSEWQKFTNVSEVLAASIIKAMIIPSTSAAVY
jgi:hypothetical protein